MSPLSSRISERGVLNLPGTTYAAKRVTEDALLEDAQTHHCFFRAAGLHNHLSHHVLAAYDLGAPAGLIKKIYSEEAKIQRPILLDDKDKDIVVTPDTWIQFVGNTNAYGAFVAFFTNCIQSTSVLEVLETYVFSRTANENGTIMLVRLMSGALHPFIQVGYGLEFGDELLVATGLAQTAVHQPLPPILFSFRDASDNKPDVQFFNDNTTPHRPSPGPSLLEILREVYESSILHPVMPYDPNALLSARLRAVLADGRPEEIRRIASQFDIDESLGEAEFDSKLEECIWVSTLLMFATGKEGRKPRLDFFLMHLLTSSLFFKSFFGVLKNPTHKANLLRAFIPGIILVTLVRGRPVINPELLMTYTDKPRPPISPESASPKPHRDSLGSPLDDDDYNPWPSLISSAIHAPDCHVVKSMRSLVYAAREYGDKPPGSVIGALMRDSSEETHPGISKLDGTIFVRAAGIMMDYMGWVTHGQHAREDWDRSALGWDEAWLDED